MESTTKDMSKQMAKKIAKHIADNCMWCIHTSYEVPYVDDVDSLSEEIEKILYEEKIMKCPHCNRGNLIKRELRPHHPYGYFDCDECGRGWNVQEDGTMISEGASDRERYDPKTKIREVLGDE